MSNEVYANGNEVSCKAAAGKSVAAFPDVCFTPPQTPATPPGVPIPYPNTGMASDTSSGSKTVQISGQEVMLKDSSFFKTSTGDEAGSAPKKNVITSVIQGKCYYTAWSMDVKIEGENAVRHLDMMTHNHASTPGGTAPWPYTDSMAMSDDSKCAGDKRKKEDACKGKEEPHCPGVLKRAPEDLKEQVKKAPSKRGADVQALGLPALGTGQSRSSLAGPAATQEAECDECVKKSRCHLKPYDEKKGQSKCCPGQTPHHVPPKACFHQAGVKKYDDGSALCVCMEGTSQHYGSHGKNHAAIDYLAANNKPEPIEPGQDVSIADYNKICAKAVAAQCGCDPDCIQQQLDESLKPTNRKIKHVPSNSSAPLEPELTAKLDAPPAPSIDV